MLVKRKYTIFGDASSQAEVCMCFTFARVSAMVQMRVDDYYQNGKRWWVRLHEKGGKRHEVPAHHNAEAYLDAYLVAAGIREEKKSPLFRSIVVVCAPGLHRTPSRGSGLRGGAGFRYQRIMLLLPAAMAIMLDSRLGPVPCAVDSTFPQRRLGASFWMGDEPELTLPKVIARLNVNNF